MGQHAALTLTSKPTSADRECGLTLLMKMPGFWLGPLEILEVRGGEDIFTAVQVNKSNALGIWLTTHLVSTSASVSFSP